MQNKTCQDCVYCQLYPGKAKGYCRRYPPLPCEIKNGRSTMTESEFPKIVPDFTWCGEFKEKEGKK